MDCAFPCRQQRICAYQQMTAFIFVWYTRTGCMPAASVLPVFQAKRAGLTGQMTFRSSIVPPFQFRAR